MDNIILIGMPSAGKSSAGVVLAKALGKSFLDADLLIQEQEGELLQSILNTRGIEAFLDLEGDVLASIQCSNTVIAPGGSSIYRDHAMQHLRELGAVVYLQLSLEEVERRLNNLSSRGVALRPGETLADLYNFRVPLYEKYAHITIPCDGQDLGETVAAIRAALDAYSGKEI